MTTWRYAAAALGCVALLAAGCTAPPSGAPVPGRTPTPTRTASGSPQACVPASTADIPTQPGAPTPLPTAATAQALLGRLTVAPRLGGLDYCREAFGADSWLDLDRNGCSARQDTLVRQAVEVQTGLIRSHGSTCQEVLAGTWVDPYTGARMTVADMKDGPQAATVQVDHIVSLYEAWVSGAKNWSPRQRVIFANDVATPELFAVAGAVNSVKAFRGADSWAPPDPARRCPFAKAYVTVKATYRLTVTAAERQALSAMLDTCAA